MQISPKAEGFAPSTMRCVLFLVVALAQMAAALQIQTPWAASVVPRIHSQPVAFFFGESQAQKDAKERQGC